MFDGNGKRDAKKAPDCLRPPDVFCVYEKLRESARASKMWRRQKNDQTAANHTESS